jgi:hypothetical protein
MRTADNMLAFLMDSTKWKAQLLDHWLEDWPDEATLKRMMELGKDIPDLPCDEDDDL